MRTQGVVRGSVNTRQESADRSEAGEVRIDRWLWAARFFKTRQLAVAALKAGHVEHNGRKAKPSRPVRPGDMLVIRRDQVRFEVEVTEVREKRVGAELAQQMYSETEESVARRELAETQRAAGARAVRYSDGRPGKKERRELARVKRGGLP